MRLAQPIRLLLVMAASGLVLVCISSVSASAEPVPTSPSGDPISIRRMSPLLSLSAQHVERRGSFSRRGSDRVLCSIHTTAWRTSMRWFVVAAKALHVDLLSPSIRSNAQRAPPLDR